MKIYSIGYRYDMNEDEQINFLNDNIKEYYEAICNLIRKNNIIFLNTSISSLNINDILKFSALKQLNISDIEDLPSSKICDIIKDYLKDNDLIVFLEHDSTSSYEDFLFINKAMKLHLDSLIKELFSLQIKCKDKELQEKAENVYNKVFDLLYNLV